MAVVLKGTTDEFSASTGGKLAGPIAKQVLDYLFAQDAAAAAAASASTTTIAGSGVTPGGAQP